MKSIDEIVARILQMRKEVPAERAMLVGISGIDASGKGYITAKLAGRMTSLNVAVVNVDGWLNLPHIRFSRYNAGRHFYENALRLEEMFERLILPLKRSRSIRLTADLAEETATDFHKHAYNFANVDVILLEGIFIFKKEYSKYFDVKIWIDCSFETALRRAVDRSQEGLPPAETINAYKEIYFPAQLVHFKLDRPQDSSDLIVKNH